MGTIVDGAEKTYREMVEREMKEKQLKKSGDVLTVYTNERSI